MAEADQQEAIEICSAIVDKHGAEVERCTHAIRDGLAKHFGAGNWQVVMGQAFCYSISHEVSGWKVGPTCKSMHVEAVNVSSAVLLATGKI